ncbi:hypothetical protein LCGC14_2194040, partial [marine sediment metagenome]
MTALLTTRGEGDICTRYRPRRMSEIVGSKAAVKALSNALKMGANRPKAYLLFGDSGCGKTTAARIMAMGLNCEKGDTPEPCLECDSCKMALDGTALHITELNMADLNKKEDAEGILQEMGLRPWSGRTSFYIFDEASKVPDEIFEVREGGTIGGEPMTFDFGNPTRNSGRFFEECEG